MEQGERGEPLLRAVALRVRYPGADRDAVSGVDLALSAGEILLLTGPSGCGKSTLLQALRGVLPGVFDAEVEGGISVSGADVRGLSISETADRIGLVLQEPAAQLCNLTVDTEVAFGPENLLLPAEVCRQRVLDSLAAVSLSTKATATVDALSGGEAQRLAIASVLAMAPRVLLLDEPTATLDPDSASQIVALVRALAAAGHGVLVVQHDFEGLLPFADSMVVLEQGAVTHRGPPRVVVTELLERADRPIAVPGPALIAYAAGLRGPLPLTPEELALALGGGPGGEAPAADDIVGSVPGGSDLTTSAVRYRYRSADRIAVQDVDLAIETGTTVALVGRNGSGKSTLARLLVGLLVPQAGSVALEGRPIGRLTHRTAGRETAYVFQFPEHQFVASTVRKEIAYGLERLGTESSEIERAVADVASRLGLADKLDRHPFSLSGGEKRRLSVATMVVLRPKLIVLDEPTYGLDEANLAELVDLVFTELRQIDSTIVVITHDMGLVAEHADTVVAMDAGRVVFAGPTHTFFGSRVLAAIGQPDPPAVQCRTALVGRGWPIGTDAITIDQVAAQVGELVREGVE